MYDRRSKALLEGLEKERFFALTVEFMSDESSSNETTVLVHRPDWRSNGTVWCIIYFLCNFTLNNYVVCSNEQVHARTGSAVSGHTGEEKAYTGEEGEDFRIIVGLISSSSGPKVDYKQRLAQGYVLSVY